MDSLWGERNKIVTSLVLKLSISISFTEQGTCMPSPIAFFLHVSIQPFQSHAIAKLLILLDQLVRDINLKPQLMKLLM